MSYVQFPPSPSDLSLAFTWSPVGALATWDITHNLGFRPAGIVVIDSGDTTVYGFGIEHISNNRLILHFNAAFVGVAYLS